MNRVDEIFAETVGKPALFARNYANYLSELLARLDDEKVADFIRLLLEARDQNQKIIFAGNGGSAATASHFANDIGIGTRLYKKPFKAISITDNNAVMTAIGNDDGYDNLFVRQLHVQYEHGDILVVISASGNSPNILRAMDYVKERGGKTVALLGFDGGRAASYADLVLLTETRKGEYGPVEDMHMILDHLVGNYLMRVVREA